MPGDTENGQTTHKFRNDTFFKDLKEDASDYLTHRIELLKLSGVEKLSTSLASVAGIASLAIIGLLTLIFVSIALGFALSVLFESFLLGFSTVALLYLIATAVVYFKRNDIKVAVTNAVIKGVLH